MAEPPPQQLDGGDAGEQHQEQQESEGVLLNADLVELVLLNADLKDLGGSCARVCKLWRDVATKGCEPVYRRAFWRRLATQDEVIVGRMEPVTAPARGTDPDALDWRRECQARRHAYLEDWQQAHGGAFQTRKLCDLVGDVIFAVASTLPSEPVVCGGESGIIYFLDADAEDEECACLFQYEAHQATILAVEVKRMPEKRLLVLSGDATGSLRASLVDPVAKVILRRYKDNDFFGTAITQIQLLREPAKPDRVNVRCGGRNGGIMTACDLGPNEWRVTNAIGSATLSAGVDHLRLVPLDPWEHGPNRGGRWAMVAGTNGGRKLAVFAFDQSVPRTSYDLLHEEVTVDLSDVGALPSSSSMGLIPGGAVALGFGDGSIKLVDVATRQVVRDIHAHEDEVWDVQVCGDLIISTSRDRTVAAHRVARREGQSSEVFRANAGWIVRVKASPRRLVLVGFDASVHVIEPLVGRGQGQEEGGAAAT